MVRLYPPLLCWFWHPLCNLIIQVTRRICFILYSKPGPNLGVQNRFLLKYAARDEVELLGRGNGGIVEIRNNIAQYTEKSPLYGFLRYRRRNVIIKYLPEDCSRLIQGTLCSLSFGLRRLAANGTKAHLIALQRE